MNMADASVTTGIVLSVIVFLLGCIVGILVIDHFRRARDASRTLDVLERAAHASTEQAERLARERTEHLDATATVFLREWRTGTQAILHELRSAARERRTILEIAEGRHAIPPDSRAPQSTSITTPPRISEDATTPPSGYRACDLFKSTERESP